MKEIKITGSTMSEALSQIESLEGLRPKDSGCLRLLTEEMFSMCKDLLDVTQLDFEVKHDANQYVLRASTQTRVDEVAREQFLSMSSSGKNTANKGIKGLLDAVFEAMSFENDPSLTEAYLSYGMRMPRDGYTFMWTLSQYADAAPAENVKSAWDGMEKSIIANFADDISIGVRSGRLEMTVTKTFN
ncbi:MAG: hypothetical protein RR452_06185 [Clostridia bacterium]